MAASLTDRVYYLLRIISIRIKSAFTIRNEWFQLSIIDSESPDLDAASSYQQAICNDLRRACSLDISNFNAARFQVEDALGSLQLRKFNGEIYKPVYSLQNDQKQFLQAYQLMKVYFNGSLQTDLNSILSVIPSFARVNPNWNYLLEHNRDKIVKFLMENETQYLPSLRVDNTLRSFRNGVYCLKSDMFFPWSDSHRPKAISAACYENQNFVNSPLRYSLAEFEKGNWLEFIKVYAPTFYNVVSYQFPLVATSGLNTANFNKYSNPDLCIRFFMAMIGRMFYELSTIDQGFESFLAIIGQGGTGKSKILEMILRAVPNHFVMKNRGEEIFGMEALLGKVLIAIEECSSRSNIPAEFILQVASASGQHQVTPLVVSRKNKIQVNMKINQPMVMIGNSCPRLPNEANQFQRRMRGFLFDRPVAVEMKDHALPAKFRQEFPAFLRGCNLAYHNLIRGVTGDLMKHVPEDIMRDTNEIINSTDECRQFLDSSDLIRFDKLGIKSKKIIPLEVLVNELKKFKQEIGVHRRSRLVTKKEVYSLLEITKAKIVLFENSEEKNTDFMSFPQVDMGPWPFIRGLAYMFDANSIHTMNIERKFVYVLGIELNWIANPRVRFLSRDIGIQEQTEQTSSRGFFSKLFSLKQHSRFLGHLDHYEKENFVNFYEKVKRSVTYIDSQSGSIRSITGTGRRKKFKTTPHSSVLDEFGLSPFDYQILKDIKNRVDLEALATNGALQITDEIDGDRFFRFEVYALYQRVRVRSLHKYPQLKAVVKLLGFFKPLFN